MKRYHTPAGGAFLREGWRRAQLLSRLPAPPVVLLLTVVLQEQRGTRNLFKLPLQTALCTVCGEKRRVSIHSTGPCCKCDSFCPEGQARLSHLRCMVEKMCMIRYFIPHLNLFVCLSSFLPFSFKAGPHHETNGTNLTT